MVHREYEVEAGVTSLGGILVDKFFGRFMMQVRREK